jgi:hypothetical protein
LRTPTVGRVRSRRDTQGRVGEPTAVLT